MLDRIRAHRPTHGVVVGYLALFVALGGSSYAAVNLSKNSVGAKQIKPNAVRSSDVKNGSLLPIDFRAGSFPADPAPAGPQGPQGPAGPEGVQGVQGEPGEDGAPDAFARVRSDGVLEGGAAQSNGITQSMVQHENTPATADANTSPTGPGVYCFGGLGFDPTSVTVSLDNTDSMPAIGSLAGGSLNFIATAAVFKGEDLSRCNSGHGQVRVAIEQVDQTNAPTLANHGFFIWFER